MQLWGEHAEAVYKDSHRCPSMSTRGAWDINMHAHLRFSFFWSLGPGHGGGNKRYLKFHFSTACFVVWNIDVVSVQSEVVSCIEVFH